MAALYERDFARVEQAFKRQQQDGTGWSRPTSGDLSHPFRFPSSSLHRSPAAAPSAYNDYGQPSPASTSSQSTNPSPIFSVHQLGRHAAQNSVSTTGSGGDGASVVKAPPIAYDLGGADGGSSVGLASPLSAAWTDPSIEKDEESPKLRFPRPRSPRSAIAERETAPLPQRLIFPSTSPPQVEHPFAHARPFASSSKARPQQQQQQQQGAAQRMRQHVLSDSLGTIDSPTARSEPVALSHLGYSHTYYGDASPSAQRKLRKSTSPELGRPVVTPLAETSGGGGLWARVKKASLSTSRSSPDLRSPQASRAPTSHTIHQHDRKISSPLLSSARHASPVLKQAPAHGLRGLLAPHPVLGGGLQAPSSYAPSSGTSLFEFPASSPPARHEWEPLPTTSTREQRVMKSPEQVARETALERQTREGWRREGEQGQRVERLLSSPTKPRVPPRGARHLQQSSGQERGRSRVSTSSERRRGGSGRTTAMDKQREVDPRLRSRPLLINTGVVEPERRDSPRSFAPVLLSPQARSFDPFLRFGRKVGRKMSFASAAAEKDKEKAKKQGRRRSQSFSSASVPQSRPPFRTHQSDAPPTLSGRRSVSMDTILLPLSYPPSSELARVPTAEVGRALFDPSADARAERQPVSPGYNRMRGVSFSDEFWGALAGRRGSDQTATPATEQQHKEELLRPLPPHAPAPQQAQSPNLSTRSGATMRSWSTSGPPSIPTRRGSLSRTRDRRPSVQESSKSVAMPVSPALSTARAASSPAPVAAVIANKGKEVPVDKEQDWLGKVPLPPIPVHQDSFMSSRTKGRSETPASLATSGGEGYETARSELESESDDDDGKKDSSGDELDVYFKRVERHGDFATQLRRQVEARQAAPGTAGVEVLVTPTDAVFPPTPLPPPAKEVPSDVESLSYDRPSLDFSVDLTPRQPDFSSDYHSRRQEVSKTEHLKLPLQRVEASPLAFNHEQRRGSENTLLAVNNHTNGNGDGTPERPPDSPMDLQFFLSRHGEQPLESPKRERELPMGPTPMGLGILGGGAATRPKPTPGQTWAATSFAKELFPPTAASSPVEERRAPFANGEEHEVEDPKRKSAPWLDFSAAELAPSLPYMPAPLSWHGEHQDYDMEGSRDSYIDWSPPSTPYERSFHGQDGVRRPLSSRTSTSSRRSLRKTTSAPSLHREAAQQQPREPPTPSDSLFPPVTPSDSLFPPTVTRGGERSSGYTSGGGSLFSDLSGLVGEFPPPPPVQGVAGDENARQSNGSGSNGSRSDRHQSSASSASLYTTGSRNSSRSGLARHSNGGNGGSGRRKTRTRSLPPGFGQLLKALGDEDLAREAAHMQQDEGIRV